MIITDQKIRRLNRVRAKIAKNIGIPRMSVFRSNRHLWVQIIDDKHGKTLASSSTKTLKSTGTKIERAIALGKEIATQAITKKISKIRFDRGVYKYHGRVKALAEAARSGGLKF